MSQLPQSLPIDARYLDDELYADTPEITDLSGWSFDDAGTGWAGRDETLPREHGRTLAGLGLVYLRHNHPARAMVLGLAAMSMGDLRPATILMVGEAMLAAGDPEQALSVLSRFDRDDGLEETPSQAERAARHYLAARVLYRRGNIEAAQDEMAIARKIAATGASAGDAP
ncbi:tetratricopeptide repeat protein [Paracoccus sediminicola]|uniref:tetratricopeptide repeat protein n=1 Tax=Paracoccus sediminicola TaxID=3017783 RepID=UPI0022F02F98|nr:hypothetical protein [Paracoccus sediminicola]WBU57195.1 hypothetical protein PAF18_01740 [Paracoccus sediminicola]